MGIDLGLLALRLVLGLFLTGHGLQRSPTGSAAKDSTVAAASSPPTVSAAGGSQPSPRAEVRSSPGSSSRSAH